MSSNDTHLTLAIADLVIFEGISFNIAQKPKFKKVLYLTRSVSKCYNPSNRNIIDKYLLDVIHDQNKQINLIMINKEAYFLGLLFIG